MDSEWNDFLNTCRHWWDFDFVNGKFYYNIYEKLKILIII